ncbi:MAG: hypothetical protein EOP01_07515 [Propionibacteriaceae bacterium]|nr:MAG: hypothetical protein EOP01_07515 [Propionibacteriaceae bacterium]
MTCAGGATPIVSGRRRLPADPTAFHLTSPERCPDSASAVAAESATSRVVTIRRRWVGELSSARPSPLDVTSVIA